jgi:hypothetical protein
MQAKQADGRSGSTGVTVKHRERHLSGDDTDQGHGRSMTSS